MSESAVYIGSKSLGAYLDAVDHQIEENGSCEVYSRGKENNATAIDVVCIVKRRKDLEITSFDLYTEAFYENEEGEQVEIGDDEDFEDYEDEGYEVTKVSGLKIELED